MPHEESPAGEWFDLADEDLWAAELDLREREPLIRDALFHCQQAVEKALKGFLVWHDRPFAKVHDLRQVSEPCIAIAPELAPLLAGRLSHAIRLGVSLPR